MLKRIANPDSTLMRIANPHERAATFSAADLFSGIGRLRRAVVEGYVLTCVNI